MKESRSLARRFRDTIGRGETGCLVELSVTFTEKFSQSLDGLELGSTSEALSSDI